MKTLGIDHSLCMHTNRGGAYSQEQVAKASGALQEYTIEVINKLEAFYWQIVSLRLDSQQVIYKDINPIM